MIDKPPSKPKANPEAGLRKDSEVEAMKNATYVKHLQGEGSTAVHKKSKRKRTFPSQAQMAAASAKNKKRKKK